MKRTLHIESNSCAAVDNLGRKTFRMELRGDAGLMHSGQFVDIAVPGLFLRRPISVCDSSEGSVLIYYKVVGEGTARLAQMLPGESLDVLVGLGHGFDPLRCSGKALLVGGGLGAAPMHLLCRELRSLGRAVTVVLGFNTASEAVLLDEFCAMGASLHVATMDGSLGVRGLVTDAIPAGEAYDCFYTCGPIVMMKAVCKALGDIPGQASLEERMGCGAGFCYGCSCHTASGTRRICKDGPVFDKEDIIW